jgi:hypothetical protein
LFYLEIYPDEAPDHYSYTAQALCIDPKKLILQNLLWDFIYMQSGLSVLANEDAGSDLE